MILDDIVAHKKKIIPHLKEVTSIQSLEALACEQPGPLGFGQALTNTSQVALIAEIKRASPSAGWIRHEVDSVALGKTYEACGASAISVLTEETFFKGSVTTLHRVKDEVRVPVLCKDFIIDAYQIYEARAFGADAVLLIVAILTDKELSGFLELCERIELDALVEVHTRREMERALEAGAKIVGINNRDLKTFTIDLSTTVELAAGIPKGTVCVSESGVRSKEDVRFVQEAGVDAVLVGTVLMESDDVGKKVREIVGGSW
jgi:indole-3-glycerol phosphate synthase